MRQGMWLIAMSVSLIRSTTPIQHEQYLFVANNTDVEYLAFLSQQGGKNGDL
jgi:hypothetical protein